MTAKIKYTKQIQAFDPKAQFLVRRTFKSNGTTYFGGEEFKKDAVDVRRLRQLFEGGYILVAEEVEVEQRESDNQPVQEVPPTVESAKAEESAVEAAYEESDTVEADDGLTFVQPKKRGPKPKAK